MDLMVSNLAFSTPFPLLARMKNGQLCKVISFPNPNSLLFGAVFGSWM